jgi:hypothetical protein
MRRFIGMAAAAASGLALLVAAGTAGADPGHGFNKTGSSTTLDACGYFIGTQTPSNDSTNTSNGVMSETQHGTWTGVENNYVFTPVASLGDVHGAYTEVTQTTADGTTTGTETFTSNAGKIDQAFSYGPSVPGYFSVTVTATRDLAFLTSDTNGNCYSGPFPRS